MPLSHGRGDALGPDLAVAADGTAVLAWAEAAGAKVLVEASVRSPGPDSRWGKPAILDSQSSPYGNPKVAATDGGWAAVVWDSKEGVYASTRAAAGRWDDQPALVSAPDSAAFDPHVAVDPHGDVIAAWRSYDEPTGTWHVRSATHAAGQPWDPPESIGEGLAGDIGMDAAGNAVASLEQGPNGTMQVAMRPIAGAWTKPTTLEPDKGRSPPDLAVDAAGRAVAVWEYGPAAEEGEIHAAISSTSTGAWSPTETIPGPLADRDGSAAFHPYVAITARRAVAVWWRSVFADDQRIGDLIQAADLVGLHTEDADGIPIPKWFPP